MRRAAGRLDDDDPLVDIVKSATLLRNLGRTDAYNLSPKQITFAIRVAEEDERKKVKANAVATAIGMSGDKKIWAALDG